MAVTSFQITVKLNDVKIERNQEINVSLHSIFNLVAQGTKLILPLTIETNNICDSLLEIKLWCSVIKSIIVRECGVKGGSVVVCGELI